MKNFAMYLLCLATCFSMWSCTIEKIPTSAKIRQIIIADFGDMPPILLKESWDTEFSIGDTMCYPDMYIQIYDGNGTIVYNSLPEGIYNNATEWSEGNTVLPNYSYFLNFLELCIDCQYYLHLYDKDEKGSVDDLMEIIPFTVYLEGCNKKNENLWINTFEKNSTTIAVDMVYEY